MLTIAGLLAALLLAAGWGVWHARGKAAALRSAQAQLVEISALADEIEALRQKPARIDAEEMPVQDLTRLIERAAAAAGIEPQQLVRIWPEPARRIAETDYKEKTTSLLLRDASLEQTLRLVHALTQGPVASVGGASKGASLGVPSIRLTAPRRDTTDNRWHVELTINYLLYAPPAPGSPGSASGSASGGFSSNRR